VTTDSEVMRLDVQGCLDLWPCVKIMVAVCNGYTYTFIM